MSLRRTFVALLGAAVLLSVPLLSRWHGSDEPVATWQPAPVGARHFVGVDGHRLPAKITLTEAVGQRPGEGPLGTYTSTGGSDVGLTFDDGPHPVYTPQILSLLRQHEIKATFCLVGTEAEAYPELVQAIVKEGHTLCNHSWHHDLRLGSQSEGSIRVNLKRTNEAIRKAVPGARIRYYRQPGGMWTPQVIAVAQSLGMRSLHWDVDPQDWRQNADAIYQTIATRTKAGSIVLMHDAGGNREGTLSACRRLFPQLKARFKLSALP